MTKFQSLYLDVVRFIAAIAVFFAHAPIFLGGYLWQFGQFGHQAVVIFFVLSGFVIAFVAEEKEVNLRDYVINRITRIYSVAVPALLISIIVYYLAIYFESSVISAFSHKMLDPTLTIVSALTFTNQSWTNVTVFANPPYWSLGYEVLYYALFAVIFYTKGWVKFGLACLVTAIMGPSIALYLPIWFAGVAAYYINRKDLSVSSATANCLFVLNLIVIVFLLYPSTVEATLALTHTHIYQDFIHLLIPPADHFIYDYVLAFSVVCNILVTKYLNINWLNAILTKFQSSIRYMASFTFSLYLYHFPILCFYAILLPFEQFPIIATISILIISPLTIVALSYITEKRRHLLRDYLEYNLFSRKRPDQE